MLLFTCVVNTIAGDAYSRWHNSSARTSEILEARTCSTCTAIFRIIFDQNVKYTQKHVFVLLGSCFDFKRLKIEIRSIAWPIWSAHYSLRRSVHSDKTLTAFWPHTLATLWHQKKSRFASLHNETSFINGSDWQRFFTDIKCQSKTNRKQIHFLKICAVNTARDVFETLCARILMLLG